MKAKFIITLLAVLSVLFVIFAGLNQFKIESTVKMPIIVNCKSIQDIANAIDKSKGENIPFAIRSGGHSYERFSLSSGLVIDVSPMNHISLSDDLSLVKLGAGCRFKEVYEELWKYKRTIVGGSCGTVGVSGFTLGGGYGFLSRMYGLAIDQLVELEVVDVNGNLLIANETTNSDLFWACRGGGGGNFGVVASLTFKTIPIDQVVFFKIIWPWEYISEVISAWQKWAPNTLNELTSVLVLPIKRNDEIWSSGIFLGDQVELAHILSESLLKTGHPRQVILKTVTWLEAVNLLDNTSKVKEAFKAKSDFIKEPLNAQAIDTIIEYLGIANSKIKKSMLILDAYGGAINTVAKQASAFVHRDDLYSIQYLAYWQPDDEEAETVNRKWVAEFYAKMRPFASGFAYQNYIDADLVDWQYAYYGSNLVRLIKVKSRYDPSNIFKFPMSIPVR